MAGTSLLALIDDISSMLDSVATMTKVATKKTAGVLGDDLALNAEQVTGVRADRELAVVWAVAKGSLVNKAILVPAALLASAVAPWLVTPALVIGGAYLCFEGFEKVAHKLLHNKKELDREQAALGQAALDPKIDLVALEAQKIKGAIRTDFVLSAEIIVIALGEMVNATMSLRVGALVTVALLMTVGVYGLVAGIVKLDDAGLALSKRTGLARTLGRGLLAAAPKLLTVLSFAGTVAMFLVGGSIVLHGLPALHHQVEHLAGEAGTFGSFVRHLSDALVGLTTGAILVAVAAGAAKAKRLAGSALGAI